MSPFRKASLDRNETNVIRSFHDGDESAFRRLNEEWIARYFCLEPKDAVILGNPHAIIESGGRILMAASRTEAVGCCALIPLGSRSFEVSKMAVTESHQRRGIGRQLMTAVIEEARRLGAKRVYLETNEVLRPAIRLYESLGFKHISPDQITPSPYQRANVYMELFL